HLHAGMCAAGRTSAPARLAGDAQPERLRHLVGREGVGSELASDGEPQCVGAPARDVTLLARDPVGWAHHAARERTASAVVVAHLDRALETAARARIAP